VQLDDIREANRRLQQRDGRYHMIFAGPPGTGKTSMASLVAKIMTKMKLVKSPKVVFVNNSLELLAGFSGQTAGKVDAKVEEAKGGVLFIDEAYSIVKKEGPGSGGGGDQFGREAIDTIMKHLDPPACVFIFAGYTEVSIRTCAHAPTTTTVSMPISLCMLYSLFLFLPPRSPSCSPQPMDEFLRVNEGLGRRIPFRYTFEAYSIPELVQICSVMATAKGETLGADVLPALPSLLAGLDPVALKHHNAGLINNLVSFAQIERDGRLDLDLAEENPELTCQLDWEDFQAALPKVLRMLDRGPNGPGGIHAGGGDNGMRPKVAVQAQAQP
jgi:SpoVK/Ycf46/Vps4 family AAA+-type ATPase